MIEPQKYRKKPVVIEAIEWTGKNLLQVYAFMHSFPERNCKSAEDAWDNYEEMIKRDGLIIKTLEGEHLASIGDFIIKGVHGEFYPCKPDIFAKTYEPAE
jgi:hypothetical protein